MTIESEIEKEKLVKEICKYHGKRIYDEVFRQPKVITSGQVGIVESAVEYILENFIRKSEIKERVVVDEEAIVEIIDKGNFSVGKDLAKSIARENPLTIRGE